MDYDPQLNPPHISTMFTTSPATLPELYSPSEISISCIKDISSWFPLNSRKSNSQCIQYLELIHACDKDLELNVVQ